MSSRPQPAEAADALMTELATIPNHLGFVVFDLTGKKVCACLPLSMHVTVKRYLQIAASGELEAANPLTFLNMLRCARPLRADVTWQLLMHAAFRDAHALVGCSEKKQELKRLLVTFDDKEYVASVPSASAFLTLCACTLSCSRRAKSRCC